MKTASKYFFLLLFIAVILQGCSHFSFEKRRYRDGFYVSDSKVNNKRTSTGDHKKAEYKPICDPLNVSDPGVPEIFPPTGTAFSHEDKSEIKNISSTLPLASHVPGRTKVRLEPRKFLHRSDGGETHIGFMALLALILAVIFFFISGMAVGVWMGVWLVTAGLSLLISVIYAFFSRSHSDTESDASVLVAKILLALFVVGILAWLAIANA